MSQMPPGRAPPCTSSSVYPRISCAKYDVEILLLFAGRRHPSTISAHFQKTAKTAYVLTFISWPSFIN